MITAWIDKLAAALNETPGLLREGLAELRRNRAENARWRQAETMSDLGELVAQFVEGKLHATPDHGGPRDEETIEIAAPVAHANRSGLVTDCSQPGGWYKLGDQRAAIEGFATAETVEKLRRLTRGTRLVMQVAEPLPAIGRVLGRSHRTAVAVSRWLNGRTITAFGYRTTATQAASMFDGAAGGDLAEAMRVTIYDPEWGPSDLLWERLGTPDWDNPPPPPRTPEETDMRNPFRRRRAETPPAPAPDPGYLCACGNDVVATYGAICPTCQDQSRANIAGALRLHCEKTTGTECDHDHGAGRASRDDRDWASVGFPHLLPETPPAPAPRTHHEREIARLERDVRIYTAEREKVAGRGWGTAAYDRRIADAERERDDVVAAQWAAAAEQERHTAAATADGPPEPPVGTVLESTDDFDGGRVFRIEHLDDGWAVQYRPGETPNDATHGSTRVGWDTARTTWNAGTATEVPADAPPLPPYVPEPENSQPSRESGYGGSEGTGLPSGWMPPAAQPWTPSHRDDMHRAAVDTLLAQGLSLEEAEAQVGQPTSETGQIARGAEGDLRQGVVDALVARQYTPYEIAQLTDPLMEQWRETGPPGDPMPDSDWREVEPSGAQPDGEFTCDDAVGDRFSRRWEQPHPDNDGTTLETTISATAIDNGERRSILVDTEWRHLDADGEEIASWGDQAESITDGPADEAWPTPADVRAELDVIVEPPAWDETPLREAVPAAAAADREAEIAELYERAAARARQGEYGAADSDEGTDIDDSNDADRAADDATEQVPDRDPVAEYRMTERTAGAIAAQAAQLSARLIAEANAEDDPDAAKELMNKARSAVEMTEQYSAAAREAEQAGRAAAEATANTERAPQQQSGAAPSPSTPPPGGRTTTSSTATSSSGGSMGSIDEVRAGIMNATSTASNSVGALQQAHSELEQAQGALMHATEGSGQADVSEANGLIAQAISAVLEVQQTVSAAIQAAESVANRL